MPMSDKVKGKVGFKEKVPSYMKFTEKMMKDFNKRYSKKFKDPIKPVVVPATTVYANPSKKWNGLYYDENN